MKCSIGFLSNVFKITTQTIHHYEKLGLITSHRDRTNGYRWYDSYTFQKLGTIKKLRNAGFSLKDSTFVYQAATKEEIISQYQRRKKEVYLELVHQQRILEQLDCDLERLTSSLISQNEFAVQEEGPFYRITSELSVEDKKKSSWELSSLWYQHIFFTSTSLLLPFPKEEGKEISFGLIASKQVYQEFLDSKPEGVTVIEQGKFAIKTLSYQNEIDYKLLYEEVETYLQTSGHILRFPPFTRLVTSFLDVDNNKVNVFDLYLPIQ